MFEVAQYAPLLHTRQSEVRALRELPDSTKDLMLPLFVLRPWPRAKSIDLAFDKMVESTGGRLFGVDLENEYPAADLEKPAQVEFDELRSPDAAFGAYYDRIAEVDGAIPVLQLTGDLGELEAQVARIVEIGRGGFARIRLSDTDVVPQILEAIDGLPAVDFTIFIDAGWARDVLQQSNWAIAVAQQFFDQEPDRPIVICGSSFPMAFSKMGGSKEFDINERLLFTQVRNNLNANLVYGDWASTRPPSYDDGIKRTVARLDVAQLSEWPIFRARKVLKENELGEEEEMWETYQEVADRLVASAYWDDVPSIWGRYALECTADDLPTSIKSPQTAAAVRINIHMHVQSHSNTPELLNNTDDPYED